MASKPTNSAQAPSGDRDVPLATCQAHVNPNFLSTACIPKALDLDGEKAVIVGMDYREDCTYSEAWLLVPAEQWHGPTSTAEERLREWNAGARQRGVLAGVLARHRGKPVVLTRRLLLRSPGALSGRKEETKVVDEKRNDIAEGQMRLL